MVRPLVYHHPQDEPLRRLPQNPKLLRNHTVAIDHDPGADPLQDRIGRTRQGQDVVLLVEFISGMHDPVRDVAVVGQQQETLGVTVQPPHRVNPLPDLDDVHYRPAVSLVLRRRDIAARFVEDQIPRSLRSQ